ncbi:hypothetical protein [Pseudolysinimonas kribbensis]|uniref:hypothetical protein n=1 Tax=Pseudolysinimonas kribbensis TaxID=433641 RepID=UPI003D67EB6D
MALEHTPVENYTMLASAGLDPGITSASDLRVDPGHVWATQSSSTWSRRSGAASPCPSIWVDGTCGCP